MEHCNAMRYNGQFNKTMCPHTLNTRGDAHLRPHTLKTRGDAHSGRQMYQFIMFADTLDRVIISEMLTTES